MKISIIIFLCMVQLGSAQSFKDEQVKFSRVKTAFTEKESAVDSLLTKHNIKRTSLNIFLRAFKNEMKLELWGKNSNDQQYQLIKIYPFCETSGELGPKRKEGDLQIPEGVYVINHFNPESSYYLSLGINYPNKSDAILGVKEKLGGDIYIHGNCVTIGCIPITDDLIKELYLFAVEAKNNGQQEIPVHIFPTTLDKNHLSALCDATPFDSLKHHFWQNIAPIYQYFEQSKAVGSISIDSEGRYLIQ